ncbi:MAG: D-arabinono-1,4-lactone oxidase [Actinomycetes bacterium]
MRNWSGHVEFSATAQVAPTTLGDLQATVARASRVRPLGTAHSFNDIADTTGIQVSVTELPGEIEIDTDRRIARVPGGMRYGEVARRLDGRGWAVHNMASLGHISVAGTVSTGTHGSGDRNPTLSATVRGLQLVRADGSLEVIDAGDPALAGAVVALGALGVVTTVDVTVEPAFTMRQYVFDGVSHDALLASFDEAFGSAYSVSLFTCWTPDLVGQVWMKRREGTEGPWPDDHFLDGRLADGKRHPLPGHDPVHCTDQGGAPGPWHERLPHFRLDFTPSSGDELQTEYLVPRTEAVGLLRDLAALAPRIHPVLHVSEVRTMAADDLWLSGAFGRDTVGIHFTWQRRPEVLDLLPDLDALFAERGGRPHWGKLFAADGPSLRSRYPRFEDFRVLTADYDPQGKFRNRFMDALLASG